MDGAGAANGNMDQQRLNLALNDSTRRKLDNHGRTIGSTDGHDKTILRQWIQGINNAQNRTQALDPLMLEMIGYLVKGELCSFVNDTIAALPAAQHTWQDIRTAIETHFLGGEEQEYLRDQVATMKQQAFESVTPGSAKYESEKSDVIPPDVFRPDSGTAD